MRIIKYLIILLIVVVGFHSCNKIEQLPNIPNIKFTSFEIFDTIDILGNSGKAGKLKFYFEDGDGDIGLDEPADSLTDTTNMFLELYRKTNGNMVLSTDESDPLLPSSSYRIPYMERLGQNKILKGTISVILLYLDYSPTDTVRYDFFIRDRALNESNIVSTSEIVISSNNIYTE
jgi:hypothetical protein